MDSRGERNYSGNSKNAKQGNTSPNGTFQTDESTIKTDGTVEQIDIVYRFQCGIRNH